MDDILLGTTDDLDDSASLLKSGILDSTGAVELVMFLEETFGLELRPDELVPQNFDSVDLICRFVERKRAATGRNPE